MNLKAAGIADYSVKMEAIRQTDTSAGAEIKQLETASDISKMVKRSGDIEKTAAEVQDYLKNLVEDKDTLKEVLEYINSDLESNNTRVEFSFNDKICQMMVQVKDKKTGEVIRSLPPEHLVKLMEKFREYGTLEGVLLSKQI